MLTTPVTAAPIIAASTIDQLNDLPGAVGCRLSEEEMTKLNAVSSYPREWWRSKLALPVLHLPHCEPAQHALG